MISVAWVSGQAGRAAWRDGDGFVVISAGRSGEFRVRPCEFPRVFDDCGDVQRLENVTKDAVAGALYLGWRRDRALHLMLILLDASATQQARTGASPALESLFSGPAVEDFVAGVLFSAPLPPSADPRGALELAQWRGGPRVIALLRSLGIHQPAIALHRRTWNELSADMFGGAVEKKNVERAVVESGLFRHLALSDQAGLEASVGRLNEWMELDVRLKSVIEEWALRSLADARDREDTPIRDSSRGRAPALGGGAMPPFRSFDADYVKRLTAGDPATQEDFFEYFGSLLRIKLRARVRSRELREDILLETFRRVFAFLSEGDHVLEHPERLGAFVNSLCNNVVMERFRSEAKAGESSSETINLADDHEGVEVTLTAQGRATVGRVLGTIPPKDREILKAIFLDERDKSEVCREMGVDGDYLGVLVNRAKAEFRAVLDGYDGAYQPVPR